MCLQRCQRRERVCRQWLLVDLCRRICFGTRRTASAVRVHRHQGEGEQELVLDQVRGAHPRMLYEERAALLRQAFRLFQSPDRNQTDLRLYRQIDRFQAALALEPKRRANSPTDADTAFWIAIEGEVVPGFPAVICKRRQKAWERAEG